MTQITAYLTFKGNCREAMTFYHQHLGGDLTIHDFSSAPGAEQMSAETKNQVMHANIMKDGNAVLMASDSGDYKGELIQGNTITLSLNCTSEAEIDNLFEKLSAGGTVIMPLADQFWGAKFGMFTDKFGMPWMLNYDRNPQQ